MANVTQLDLQTKGGEARIRALLEDLVLNFKGFYPERQLALVVWFGKSSGASRHNLLELFTGPLGDGIHQFSDQPLLWKSGSTGPPFAVPFVTSVDYFTGLMRANPQLVAQYLEKSEVLYFDKYALNEDIIRAFKIITEPSGLIKGWYVNADEFAKRGSTIQALLATYGGYRPQVGLLKVYESPDFQYCRGLLHTEISQRWLPFVSSEGLALYMFHSDWQSGRPGYFLFEGGSLYQILKFELKTAPEYSARVLEESRDGRYVEVYLRAVYPPEQPTT